MNFKQINFAEIDFYLEKLYQFEAENVTIIGIIESWKKESQIPKEALIYGFFSENEFVYLILQSQPIYPIILSYSKKKLSLKEIASIERFFNERNYYPSKILGEKSTVKTLRKIIESRTLANYEIKCKKGFIN